MPLSYSQPPCHTLPPRATPCQGSKKAPVSARGGSGGWNALRVTFKQRRSRLPAPRQGGGVRLCGNVWLSRSPPHPVCRFAQDDTGGNRGVIRNLFGVKYSTVKLTDTAFCFTSRAPATLRVILSEAAPPAKNHAHPPIIAAQRTPPQAGRQQAGSPLLRGTT